MWRVLCLIALLALARLRQPSAGAGRRSPTAPVVVEGGARRRRRRASRARATTWSRRATPCTASPSSMASTTHDLVSLEQPERRHEARSRPGTAGDAARRRGRDQADRRAGASWWSSIAARSWRQPASPAGSRRTASVREPKGGKVPYSDTALAQARAMDGGLPPPKPTEAGTPVPRTPAPKRRAGQPAPHAPGRHGRYRLDLAGGRQGACRGFGENGGGEISRASTSPAARAIRCRLRRRARSSTSATLRKYGNLVIVRHDADYLSVYAHNSKILVKQGPDGDQGPEDRRSGQFRRRSAQAAFRDSAARQAGRSAQAAAAAP